MFITLCGSAKFEKEFRQADHDLTLANHVVYNLAIYPSEKSNKNWYTEDQKFILDNMHKMKIKNSDAIYVICPGGYIGDSTKNEIKYAVDNSKKIYCRYPLRPAIDNLDYIKYDKLFTRTCPYNYCGYSINKPPCAVCYE